MQKISNDTEKHPEVEKSISDNLNQTDSFFTKKDQNIIFIQQTLETAT